MSNTQIQIKRSTTTATPTNGSLLPGELAYSYNSDKLFSGNSSGTGVIEIGGKYWVDTTIAAFDKANAATSSASNVSAQAFEHANNVGVSANAYAAAVGVSANAYAAAVGVSANAYAAVVGTSANAYAAAVGVSANAYAAVVGTSANAYSDATFVKLTAADQTITGNLAVTGKLTVSGNVQFLDQETLRINDPLIYLAGNNYSSDVVDIGFIANYNNGSANLHTGLFREHVNKEYYLFQGYNEEPYNNHIDVTANGFSVAVLNADLKTSNLTLGGINAISWITAAFDKANAVAISANSHANAVGVSANAYALSIVTPAFDKANGAVQTGFVTIVANGTSIVADSNNDSLSIVQSDGIKIVGNATSDEITIGLLATGVTAATYGGADTVGTFTVDQFGRITSAANASIAISAAAITSGTLTVPRGGTGVGTFTENGILFGNTAGALKVTAAGTEGQVLQASATGVPQFGMLDGGSF